MDQIDDPITPETGSVNGTTPDDAAMTAEPVGLRPGFLAELAVAMRATAERERANIGKRVEEDAAGHIEKVRARAAIETEELRRLAEEDVQHIEEWSAAEMERIRAEADQKIGDRRASLDEYLRQHDAIIDTEIQGVDAAVSDYNATLDRFFAELAGSDDPSVIVARAETLPPPPDLDQVRAQARASAVAMFAQPDAEEAAPATEPVAEATADVAPDIGSGSEGGTPTGAAETDAVTAEAVVVEMQDETTEATPVETTPTETTEEIRAEATPAAEPVPVMDPAATADTSWPEKGPEPETAGIAPSADHTSAAVRLLRSVAPWTAPTHAGSERGPDTD
jgi:hypothetical protein